MSEPKPVWNVIEGHDTSRVVIEGSVGRVVIRDTDIEVVEVLRFLGSDDPVDVFEKWPQLQQADIDHALRFGARAVESCGGLGFVVTTFDGEVVSAKLARPQTGVTIEDDPEDDCYDDLPTTPAHIRFMAFGAGGLMFALAVLVLWFLFGQLWG